jgi:outer membrane protein TolC
VRAEVDRVGQLLAVGKAPEVDRLRAEAALASAEAEATRADTELDSAERDLARLIGVEVDAVRADRLTPLRHPAAATADPPDRLQLQQRAIETSPDVARGRSALAGAEAARALARTAYFPKLKTTGAYQELGASELTFSSEWNVALQLAVPLWDGGATDRRVARATAGVDDARARLAQSQLDARAAVDGALASLTDAQARSAALTKAAQRLAEVARIQKLLLEVGSGTQVDYLAAEAELATTRATLAETGSAALVSRVRLALATGDLSIDWLAHNLEATPNPSNPLPSSHPENFR